MINDETFIVAEIALTTLCDFLICYQPVADCVINVYAFLMKVLHPVLLSLQQLAFDAAPRSRALLEPLQLLSPLPAPPFPPLIFLNAAATIMTGIAAVSFFSNACRFAGCGLRFDSLSELIVHIEDNHIGKIKHICADGARCRGRGSELTQS